VPDVAGNLARDLGVHSVFQTMHTEKPAPLFPAVALRRFRPPSGVDADDEVFRLEKQRDAARKTGVAGQHAYYNLDDPVFLAALDEAHASAAGNGGGGGGGGGGSGGGGGGGGGGSGGGIASSADAEGERMKRRQAATNKRLAESLDDVLRSVLFPLELVEPPTSSSAKRARRGGAGVAGGAGAAGTAGKRGATDRLALVARERQASLGNEIEALEARERDGEGLEGEDVGGAAEGTASAPRRGFGAWRGGAGSRASGAAQPRHIPRARGGRVLSHTLTHPHLPAGADDDEPGAEGEEELEEEEDDDDFNDYLEAHDDDDDGEEDGDEGGGREAEY